MILAGILFASTENFFLLLAAATIGIISPSGYEVGPFLSIEQSALSHIIPDEKRTSVFAWYNLVGSFATALGALVGGASIQVLQGAGVAEVASYRAVVVGYALMGLLLWVLFTRVSPAVEIDGGGSFEGSFGSGPGALRTPPVQGHRSQAVRPLFHRRLRRRVSYCRGLVAYWFYLRFGTEPALIGSIIFGANVLAGISSLLAARVAARIGLVRTMVFTHIPSNVMLILVPLMPNLPLAIAMLLLRFSISQMDVPTRQSYTMAVVNPDERSAAAGVTGIVPDPGRLPVAGPSPVLCSPAPCSRERSLHLRRSQDRVRPAPL